MAIRLQIAHSLAENWKCKPMTRNTLEIGMNGCVSQRNQQHKKKIYEDHVVQSSTLGTTRVTEMNNALALKDYSKT